MTWKADGTRYMFVITQRGCYLIDRKANVVRLQVWAISVGAWWGWKCGGRVAALCYPVGPGGSLPSIYSAHSLYRSHDLPPLLCTTTLRFPSLLICRHN